MTIERFAGRAEDLRVSAFPTGSAFGAWPGSVPSDSPIGC
jgi:hypothetical protein